MSLFNYFQRQAKENNNLSDACESLKENLPESITVQELECVQNSLVGPANKKRSVYGEK